MSKVPGLLKRLWVNIWPILLVNGLLIVAVLIVGWRMAWPTPRDHGLGMLAGGALVIVVGAMIGSQSTTAQHANTFRARRFGSTPPASVARSVAPVKRGYWERRDEQDNITRLSFALSAFIVGGLGILEGMLIMALSFPGP